VAKERAGVVLDHPNDPRLTIQINVILCLKIGYSLNFYVVVEGHHICTSANYQ
jgi:hypothetical protein